MFLCFFTHLLIFFVHICYSIVIDCGTPPSSAYMQITLRRGTKYQATATYVCSQSGGQRCLDGPSTRHCNADGNWSGKQPTCVGQYYCFIIIYQGLPFFKTKNSSFKMQKVFLLIIKKLLDTSGHLSVFLLHSFAIKVISINYNSTAIETYIAIQFLVI